MFLRSPAHQTPPQTESRTWLWLLLALWVLTQTWAWHHRVEHSTHWQGAQGTQIQANTAVDADSAPADNLHAGTTCEWLDHALLASAVGTTSAHLPVAHLPACSPIQPLRSFADAQTARPYLARAPPAPHHYFEGRVTG